MFGITQVILGVSALAGVSHAMNNGLVKTPPMGFLSWEKFRCNTDCTDDPTTCISEQLYMDMADAMVEHGYADAGYDYVLIDDCWPAKDRDAKGRLVADPVRFPHGIKWLSDYVHGKGLKLGIYTDMGTETCGGYPGTLDYIDIDAQTFVDWNLDSVKMDGCYNNNKTAMPAEYKAWSDAVNKTGHPMLFSCSYPAYFQGNMPIDYRYVAEICNLARLYGDIQDDWGSVSSIINFWGDHQEELGAVVGEGYVQDPDMLIIGDGALQTKAMMQTQMAIWSIVAAPMYISADLRNMSADAHAVLTNKDAIAISQDSVLQMGKRVDVSVGEMWYRPLANGDVAVALYNPSTKGPANVTVDLRLAGIKDGAAHGFEVFSGTKISSDGKGWIGAEVPQQGAVMYRLTSN